MLVPNYISRLLGIPFPLIQAGMGGVASPRLAAAVCNEGCGGILALYKHEPAEIRELIETMSSLTRSPYGVNLIPELLDQRKLSRQIQTVLDNTPTEVFFTFFGLAREQDCGHLRARGRSVLVQVGTCADAVEAIRRGASALILQGRQAGGHLLGASNTEALMQDVLDSSVRSPLIVAGGIGNGADFAALVRKGAAGCLCGTLFVATCESAAHPTYKKQIVEAQASDTAITNTFEIGWPGRFHRVIRNEVVKGTKQFGRDMIAQITLLGKTYWIPRFSSVVPTEGCRGMITHMAMYCGTSCQSVTDIRPVAEVIAQFRRDVEQSLAEENARSHRYSI